MKRIFKLAALVCVLMPLKACSLNEDTTAVSVPGDWFRKYNECQQVVNGCYMPMKSMYNGALFLATECVSDLMYCASGTLDASLDVSPAVPRYASTGWTQGYLGVQRCNFAVAGIENCGDAITDAQRAQLLCEAKALRGFYYYFLTSMFGDVPFYFDDVADEETMDKVATLPRMSATATRHAIIDDLKPVAAAVPQVRTCEAPGNRAGAPLAWMVIAKCALWNKDYDTAIEALEKLEAIYGDLALYDYEENALLRNKNTPESILEVQHIYTQGGVSYVSNLSSMNLPTKKIVDEVAYFDGVEMPEIGEMATTYAAARPNRWFISSLQTRNGPDIRAKVNMAWEYNGQEFASVGTRPWNGPKFWCPGLQASSDGNNYTVFRYADVMLMLAECWLYKKDFGKSIAYLDKTRVRAGIGPYTFRTEARLEEEIRNERGRELYGEFQRKFDLVRWDIWYDKVQECSDYTRLKNQMKPCHQYYPIPDIEVVNSGHNLDNKEYEKYGL